MRLKSALERRQRRGRPHRTNTDGEGIWVCMRVVFRARLAFTSSPHSPVVSGDESEGEGGERGGGEGESLVAQQRQLEAEKEALLHNTELVLEVRLCSVGCGSVLTGSSFWAGEAAADS